MVQGIKTLKDILLKIMSTVRHELFCKYIFWRKNMLMLPLLMQSELLLNDAHLFAVDKFL